MGFIKHSKIALFYSKRVNLLVGQWGDGKSRLALLVAKEQLELGKQVIYIDLEDDEFSIVERMMKMGVEMEVLIKRFHYASPTAGPNAEWFEKLKELAAQVSYVVIDTVGKALNREGLDGNSDKEFGNWFGRIPDPIARCGPAVVLLDHPIKVPGKGRVAAGTNRKMADLKGAAYSVDKVKDWGLGITGYSDVVLIKKGQNQPGEIDKAVAELNYVDGEGFSLDLPQAKDKKESTEDRECKKILTILKQRGAMTKTDLKTAVGGTGSKAIERIERLIANGFINDAPRGGKLSRSAQPYEDGSE